MRIVAASDLHGQLPDVEPCDVLLLAGDVCPHFRSRYVGDADDLRGQAQWLSTAFRQWLDAAPARHVVATWGNHDFIGTRPHLVPHLRWRMLVDEEAVIEGLKFYGTPHQPVFFDWAFNLEEPQLAEKWRWIPSDADVLVFHGPPRGYGDLVPADIRSPNAGRRTGSPSQLERILRVKPKLAVFGHIHSGRGVWTVDGITLANVSILDEAYKMVHKPMAFDL